MPHYSKQKSAGSSSSIQLLPNHLETIRAQINHPILPFKAWQFTNFLFLTKVIFLIKQSVLLYKKFFQ